MASPVSSLFGAPASSTGTTTTTTGITGSAAPSEQMFLQLLVAQMQNQDPTNPVDDTQFVSQLAQFSELEQLIAIRGDLDNQAAGAANAGTTSGTPAGTNAANTPGGTSNPAVPGTSTGSPASGTPSGSTTP